MHHPGPISDIDVFRNNIEFHIEQLSKIKSEYRTVDVGPFNYLLERVWAVLGDKGYQGSREMDRMIHTKKKPVGGEMKSTEEEENRVISSDRIIVENFFGRFGNIWTIRYAKYKWEEGFYDEFMKLCLCLPNYRIRIHSLRDEDREFYR